MFKASDVACKSVETIVSSMFAAVIGSSGVKDSRLEKPAAYEGEGCSGSDDRLREGSETCRLSKIPFQGQNLLHLHSSARAFHLVLS
jgi:hypothetical protein